jgi:hypothetical protein
MTAIGVIGTGNMARVLGSGWARTGHRVTFGSRDPHGTGLAGVMPEAEIVDRESAIKTSEIVVLAIPFPQVEEFAKGYADALHPKLVIDISNPFDALRGGDVAGARITADAMGPGARVVAAFKDNFAATLYPGARQGKDPADVRIAGDDPRDKAQVASLAEALGCRSLDCGGLDNGRYIDQMVSLMLLLDKKYADGTMRSGWRFALEI